jgi:GH24 family phage-related lysozyme (muramidase)
VIQQSTIDTIIGFEGYKIHAYRDTKGLWTTGVGHLIKPNEEYLITKTLTKAEVDDLLRADLAECAKCIEENVNVPISTNQFDALASLCFNIGTDHFLESSVLRHLNEGNYAQAAEDFLLWNKPSELIRRRLEEKALFERA